MVGDRPEVVLADVEGVAVEVVELRLVAGRAPADEGVPVEVAPVEGVGAVADDGAVDAPPGLGAGLAAHGRLSAGPARTGGAAS